MRVLLLEDCYEDRRDDGSYVVRKRMGLPGPCPRGTDDGARNAYEKESRGVARVIGEYIQVCRVALSASGTTFTVHFP